MKLTKISTGVGHTDRLELESDGKLIVLENLVLDIETKEFVQNLASSEEEIEEIIENPGIFAILAAYGSSIPIGKDQAYDKFTETYSDDRKTMVGKERIRDFFRKNFSTEDKKSDGKTGDI